jgi:hypothetical protein
MRKIALGILVVTIFSGCSLITEFDDPGTLYSLDGNIPNDNITVSLANLPNAVLTIALKNPLPDGDDIEGLVGDEIGLVVKNKESQNNFNLTQGTLVEDQPNEPGEYRITIDGDRTTLTFVFTNDIDGHALRADVDYEAAISVEPDNGYFAFENFTRDVDVTP